MQVLVVVKVDEAVWLVEKNEKTDCTVFCSGRVKMAM